MRYGRDEPQLPPPMDETFTCRHCGRPIQLDNTDDEHRAAVAATPPEVITAALCAAGFTASPPPGQFGDFWRHTGTDEPGSGLTLCPGKKRYTPDATYAEP